MKRCLLRTLEIGVVLLLFVVPTALQSEERYWTSGSSTEASSVPLDLLVKKLALGGLAKYPGEHLEESVSIQHTKASKDLTSSVLDLLQPSDPETTLMVVVGSKLRKSKKMSTESTYQVVYRSAFDWVLCADDGIYYRFANGVLSMLDQNGGKTMLVAPFARMDWCAPPFEVLALTNPRETFFLSHCRIANRSELDRRWSATIECLPLNDYQKDKFSECSALLTSSNGIAGASVTEVWLFNQNCTKLLRGTRSNRKLYEEFDAKWLKSRSKEVFRADVTRLLPTSAIGPGLMK